MTTLPDLLPARYPDRVGSFTGEYGINVVWCDNPTVDANPSQRGMQGGSSNGLDTVEAIEAWAAQEVQDHLAYHKKMRTTPCHPIIGETSAIYNNPFGKPGVFWVPLEVIDGATNPI